MDYEFLVVVEKGSVSSQKVVKRDTLKIYDIEPPQSILELGLRHEEQISLLAKVQNSLLGAAGASAQKYTVTMFKGPVRET